MFPGRILLHDLQGNWKIFRRQTFRRKLQEPRRNHTFQGCSTHDIGEVIQFGFDTAKLARAKNGFNDILALSATAGHPALGLTCLSVPSCVSPRHRQTVPASTLGLLPDERLRLFKRNS